MANHGHGGHGTPEPVDHDLLRSMGYEPRDVALGTLVRWLAFLGVFIIFMTAITMVMYKLFVPKTAELEKIAPIAVKAAGRRLPPNPQLQAAPKRDIVMFRRAEERVVDGYTYTREGKVALPIDVAINQVAAKGISGVTGTTEAPSAPSSYPGSGQFLPAPASAEEGAPAASGETTGDVTAPEAPVAPATAPKPAGGTAANPAHVHEGEAGAALGAAASPRPAHGGER